MSNLLETMELKANALRAEFRQRENGLWDGQGARMPFRDCRAGSGYSYYNADGGILPIADIADMSPEEMGNALAACAHGFGDK